MELTEGGRNERTRLPFWVGVEAGEDRSDEAHTFVGTGSRRGVDEGLLLITSHGNWARLADEGGWVFAAVKPWMEDLKGREAIVYLTAHGGISSLGGLVRFTGNPSEANSEIGLTRLFPFRAPIKVLANLRSPIDIYRVKDDLSFFPAGPNWGGVLQGQPIKRIPAADYERMRAAILKVA